MPEVSAALEPGPWDVAIQYQRLRPDRIRFYVPEDSPLPDLLEPRRSEYLRSNPGTSNWGGREPVFLLSGGRAEISPVR